MKVIEEMPIKKNIYIGKSLQSLQHSIENIWGEFFVFYTHCIAEIYFKLCRESWSMKPQYRREKNNKIIFIYLINKQIS